MRIDKISLITSLLLLIPCSLIAIKKTRHKKKSCTTHTLFPLNAENRINELYRSINGFAISEQERKKIEDAGGNPTYGEITFEGLTTLLRDLKLTEKDVFYDLGSGVGKVCVQVALTTPAAAIGGELSTDRVLKAEQVCQILIKNGDLKNKKKLRFIEANILAMNLKDATVIFICSTCFSKELMQQLTTKMAKLKNGLRVLTLKELAPNPAFKLINTYHVPMTWSNRSAVYLYELKK